MRDTRKPAMRMRLAGDEIDAHALLARFDDKERGLSDDPFPGDVDPRSGVLSETVMVHRHRSAVGEATP